MCCVAAESPRGTWCQPATRRGWSSTWRRATSRRRRRTRLEQHCTRTRVRYYTRRHVRVWIGLTLCSAPESEWNNIIIVRHAYALGLFSDGIGTICERTQSNRKAPRGAFLGSLRAMTVVSSGEISPCRFFQAETRTTEDIGLRSKGSAQDVHPRPIKVSNPPGPFLAASGQ